MTAPCSSTVPLPNFLPVTTSESTGVNSMGSATKKPALVALVMFTAKLQVRYVAAMHRLEGSQALRRARRREGRTLRPKTNKKTTVARPNRSAAHHMGLTPSYAIFMSTLPSP